MDSSTAAQLGHLGLTSDEVRCYLALLARGRLTARELSVAAGVGRGRIYDVTGGLLGKGAAVELAGKLRSFEALPPSVVVANLLERRRRETARLETSAQQIVNSLAGVGGEPEGPPGLLEVLRHRASVRERCAEIEDGAAEEILFLVRFPRPPGTDFFRGGDLAAEKRALDRGVELRALYESWLLDEEYVQTIRRFMAAGGKARHLRSLEIKLTVVDRAITLLPLDDEVPTSSVLVLRHKGLSLLARLAFEALWHQAEPIKLGGGAYR